MAMVINSNIQSLNAQRHLNNSLSEQNTASERLTSGKRINSAADDAAGLAIANRMTSQVKGLNMAIRNANDGVSMIQTAEGALSETTNILQRMRELSIQSANGIYDEGNRGTLNAEVQQLKSEIDRISETTSFNGLNILDGSLGKIGLQIGENANQTIDLNIQKADTKTLGMGSTSVDVIGAATTALDTADVTLSHNDVLINGQSILALGETYTGGTDNTQDLLDKINENVTGVTAGTLATVTGTAIGNGVFDVGNNFGVAVEGIDGSTKTIQVTDTKDLQGLVDKLNEEGQGTLNASITDDGYLSISAENALTITTTGGSALTSGLIDGTTQTSITLTADDGVTPITVERGISGTLDDLDDLGFRESNDPGVIEGVTPGGAAFAQGDMTINGVEIAKSESADLDDKITAINAISEESGVTATSFSQVSIDMSAATAKIVAGTIEVNGHDLIFAGGETVSGMADVFNAQTAVTGLTATVLEDRIVLEGDVSGINFRDGGANVSAVFVDATFQTSEQERAGAGASTASGEQTVAGGIKLTSKDGSPISLELTANGATNSGLVAANSTTGGTFGQSVDSLNISTAAGANKAIEILDKAIETIGEMRGELGAVTNRLDHTVKNLSNVSENAAAARSRIMDSDFAAESANLSRAQVLQQAGNAMLAQANSRPQQVLSLLQ